MMKVGQKFLVVFDHDGTLVNTDRSEFALYPGIKDLLIYLKRQNIAMSVWTARPHTSAKESLRRLGVLDFFDQIWGQGDGVLKPHPMGLADLTLGLEKSQVIHIGDSDGDIEGALNFGIEVIGACWSDPAKGPRFNQKTPHVALLVEDCYEVINKKFFLSLK